MKLIIYILIYLLLSSCGQSNSEQIVTTVSDTTTTNGLQTDTVELKVKESFNEEDLPANEYLTDRLKPIRANFKRINSIANWTFIDTLNIEDESIEGGEAAFYFQNKQLEKILKRNFGEMSQWLTEYYLLNGQLSFVFERRYQYNRYFLDKEFDFDKSEIIEDRSYFENGKLLHQINNQDCGSPFANDYLLEEQKRIKTYFDKLIRQTKKK